MIYPRHGDKFHCENFHDKRVASLATRTSRDLDFETGRVLTPLRENQHPFESASESLRSIASLET